MNNDLNGFRLLGQVWFEGDRGYLISRYDSALWALEIATGEWVRLLEESEGLSFGSLLGQIEFSEKDATVYTVVSGQLAAVKLVEIDGELSASWVSAEITNDGSLAGGFNTAEILHAGDDVLIVRSSNQIWSLDALPFAAD